MRTVHDSKNNLDAPWLLQSRSAGVKFIAVVIGVIALSLSSYLINPIGPVPITLQSQVVLLIGAFYGWRWSALTIVLWLIVGAAGLPVFANGGHGLSRFAGPTGGYLFGFPLSGAAVGWLVEHGWNGANFLRAFGAMLIGSTIFMLLGWAWLTYTIGIEAAWSIGVQPFLWGTLLTSLAAAVLLQVQYLASKESQR